ncbi:MAG TPA: response regulator [Vicinamibacterales bacterium]|jgi:DNA-binding response OmpR family regulator|nr:response regulator [Vicinamibacterales bacterium]
MTSVLVVDDDKLLRDMAARMLEHAGYSAVVASSGADALAVIKARPGIDVALIDVVLPDMSGFDLARELRRISARAHIAFMSGFTTDHFRHPVSEPCVTKPFTIDMLANVVEAALGRSAPD